MASGYLLDKVRYVLAVLVLVAGISPVHVVMPGMEHFPWGILLVLFIDRYNGRALLIYWLMAISLFLYFIVTSSADMQRVGYVMQMMNFAAPLFFYKGREQYFQGIARLVFKLYLVVGALQMLHLLSPLEPILQIFISRFSGTPLEGYRGVSMLETEPARAGFQLLYLHLLAYGRRGGWIPLLVLIFAEVVMVSATTGILLTLLYLGIFNYRLFFSPRVLILILALGIGAGYALERQPKVQLLISNFMDSGLDGVYIALAASSGGRFLGTVETIKAIGDQPLGHGFDEHFFSDEKKSVENIQVKGYNTRASPRPISPILQILYVFGILSLVPFLYAFAQHYGRADYAAIVFLLICGILYTPPGSEIWTMALLKSLGGRQQN